MAFKSENEIFNFDFADSTINSVKINDEGITINLDALIVEPENSQNENFTKSYADTTKVRFIEGKIVSGLKDGYRRYDANDKILEEIPDKSLPVDEISLILKNAKGAYLFAMDANSDSTEDLFSYTLSIEFPSEEAFDTNATNSYQVSIKFKKAIFEWDKYLNRVN